MTESAPKGPTFKGYRTGGLGFQYPNSRGSQIFSNIHPPVDGHLSYLPSLGDCRWSCCEHLLNHRSLELMIQMGSLRPGEDELPGAGPEAGPLAAGLLTPRHRPPQAWGHSAPDTAPDRTSPLLPLSPHPEPSQLGPRVWLGTRPGPEQGVVSKSFGQSAVIFDVVHLGLTPWYLFAIKELVPN